MAFNKRSREYDTKLIESLKHAICSGSNLKSGDMWKTRSVIREIPVHHRRRRLMYSSDSYRDVAQISMLSSSERSLHISIILS